MCDGHGDIQPLSHFVLGRWNGFKDAAASQLLFIIWPNEGKISPPASVV